MEIKLPQHIHKPTKVVGFDGNCVLLVAFLSTISYIGLVYSDSAYIGLLFLAALPIISFLKTKPRGFIGSLSYHLSLSEYQGYPLATQKKYHE